MAWHTTELKRIVVEEDPLREVQYRVIWKVRLLLRPWNEEEIMHYNESILRQWRTIENVRLIILRQQPAGTKVVVTTTTCCIHQKLILLVMSGTLNVVLPKKSNGLMQTTTWSACFDYLIQKTTSSIRNTTNACCAQSRTEADIQMNGSGEMRKQRDGTAQIGTLILQETCFSHHIKIKLYGRENNSVQDAFVQTMNSKISVFALKRISSENLIRYLNSKALPNFHGTGWWRLQFEQMDCKRYKCSTKKTVILMLLVT